MSSQPQNWLLISVDQWRGDWLHQEWLELPYLRSLSSRVGMFVAVIRQVLSAFLPGQVG